MKIELTEDEVRIIGSRRYKANLLLILFGILGSVLFLTIITLLLFSVRLPYALVVLGIPVSTVSAFFPIIWLQGNIQSAGRRFLEEQRHNQEMEAWEKPGVKSNPNFKET